MIGDGWRWQPANAVRERRMSHALALATARAEPEQGSATRVRTRACLPANEDAGGDTGRGGGEDGGWRHRMVTGTALGVRARSTPRQMPMLPSWGAGAQSTNVIPRSSDSLAGRP